MSTLNELKRGGRQCLAGLCTLLLCCSFSAPVMASATIEPGRSYVISGEQLQTLSDDLKKLRSINEQQRQRLTEQQQQISELQERLATAEQSLTASQEALQTAREQQIRVETSLTSANESLIKWSAEEKRTRLRIKAQRNAWETIAAGLAIAYIAK